MLLSSEPRRYSFDQQFGSLSCSGLMTPAAKKSNRPTSLTYKGFNQTEKELASAAQPQEEARA